MPVRLMHASVRPWKPPANATTAERRVWKRAIFTAFSTASAPVVRKMVFFGVLPGTILLMRSASRM